MDLHIRDYVDGDLEFVRRCYADYLAEERGRVPRLGLPDDFVDSYLPRLIAKVQERDGLFLMGCRGPERVGYLAALPKEHEAWDQTSGRVVMIMDLYVLPDRRRQGIARTLFRAVEQRYRSRGFDWITLGVMARNSVAREFYAAVGYFDTYVMMGKPLRERG